MERCQQPTAKVRRQMGQMPMLNADAAPPNQKQNHVTCYLSMRILAVIVIVLT